MDRFLVAKRPFEEHATAAAGQVPPPKRSRTSALTPQHGFGAARPRGSSYSSSAAASFSSAASAMRVMPASPVRARPALKQLALTQLAKVTSTSDASARYGFLQSAWERGDWRAVRSLMRQLQGMFISKQTLEKTGMGRLMTKIKNASKPPADTQPDAAAAAAQPSAASSTRAATDPGEAAPAAEVTAAATASLSTSEAEQKLADYLDTESNGDYEEDGDAEDGDGSTVSDACDASPAQLQAECHALALELLSVWRAQVSRELVAESASGAAGQPALDFTAYSTLKNRASTYKAIYFLVSRTDRMESTPEKVARRLAQKSPPLATDPASAAVVAQLEQMLFKFHRDRQQQLKQRANGSKSELLSSSAPSDSQNWREDEQCVTVEPPGYAQHARMLVQTLKQKASQVERLRKFVGAPEDAATAEARKAELSDIINSTRFC